MTQISETPYADEVVYSNDLNIIDQMASPEELDFEAILQAKDARILQLEEQIRVLEAKTARPVQREQPATVKALPMLVADPKTGKATCSNPEHGLVTPGVHGKCPKCFCHARWAASPAGQAATTKEPVAA